jgi:hypothetical protein
MTHESFSLPEQAVQTTHEEIGTRLSQLASSVGANLLPQAERLIRRYPIPSLLFGFGIGYALSRGLRR